jgi:hypothetical protein
MNNYDDTRVWAWDHDLAFALYCIGMPTEDIAAQMGISQRMIQHQAKADRWEDRADKVAVERALRIDKKQSEEQKQIRSLECAYARRLFGLAEQELRAYKTTKPTLLDIGRIIDLASRLGRLGSGLPLNQVDISVTHDISERMNEALEKAYGPKPIDIDPAKELPPTDP